MNQPTDTHKAIIKADAIDQATDATAALLVHVAQQAVLPRRLDEGVHAILTPDGGISIVETPGHQQDREHQWAVDHAEAPDHIHRTVTVLDPVSLVSYIGDYNGLGEDEGGYNLGVGCLELWADIDNRTIKAYCDGYDGWRRHTATLQLKTSREWVEWASIDGKLLDQVTFAEFIEDHLSTIADPDGAKLLDICQTLQVHTSAQFKQQSILANGQRVFRYEEDLEAKAGQKGDLQIPGTLTLALRPFQGSERVGITARFRFQVRDGVLRLGVKLAEPEAALEEAFSAIVGHVQAGVPVHINYGRG